MSSGRPGASPLGVELDADSLTRYRAAVVPWLVTVGTLQHGYRQLLRSTLPRITDPLVQHWLSGVEQSAAEHEQAAEELFAAFDVTRPPVSALSALGGTVLARAREATGTLQGLVSGARGSPAWRRLRQLQLSNLDSMSAFAVAQQFGLAHGRPRVVDIAFPVVHKKSEQQLLLQELFLEFATDAVLTPSDI